MENIPEIKMIGRYVIEGKEYVATQIVHGVNKVLVVLTSLEELEQERQKLEKMIKPLTD